MDCGRGHGRGRSPRWNASLMLLVLPLLAQGCSQFPVSEPLARPSVVRGASPDSGVRPIPVVWQAARNSIRLVQDVTHLPPAQPETVEVLKAPAAPVPATTPPIQVPATGPAATTAAAGPQVVPIALDTVFQIAEEQNPQIGIAREKVREACAEKRVAAARWLPDLYVGTAYYRHEGGIQNFNGDLIRSSTGAMFAGMEINGQLDLRDYAFQKVSAQRRVWQQKGELTRISTETVLEAANTYIDLLTARTGEAIAREMEADLKRLLEHTEKLAKTEPAATVEVSRIKAELWGRQQIVLKAGEQARAASAKLAYLLGVDPCTEMVPVDQQIVPIELVDATPPTCELVSLALAAGPGIQELEGLLSLIHESIEKAQGPARLLPIFGVRMAEGAFGAGPGEQTSWDNRWDLGLQARWNLTEFITLRDRRLASQAKIQQAHLAYQDLRNKLTMGVHEARGAIYSGRDQIRLARDAIQSARDSYRLSDQRFKNNLPGSSPSEVLLATRGVGLAQLNYLTAVAAYDKAQVRLMILTGTPAALECHP